MIDFYQRLALTFSPVLMELTLNMDGARSPCVRVLAAWIAIFVFWSAWLMADDPEVSSETEHARFMLHQSEKALLRVLMAFDSMEERMLHGEEPLSETELSKACASLGNTRSKLLDEVNKYERHVLLSNGLTAEAPINFDAVKDEIGSSLDRIRKARDAEGFSELSES